MWYRMYQSLSLRIGFPARAPGLVGTEREELDFKSKIIQRDYFYPETFTEPFLFTLADSNIFGGIHSLGI